MYVKYVVNFLFQPASLHLYFCHLSSLLCTLSISPLPPPFLICPVFFLFDPSVTFPTFSPPLFSLMHVSLSLFFALLRLSICVFVFSGTFLHIFKNICRVRGPLEEPRSFKLLYNKCPLYLEVCYRFGQEPPVATALRP